MHKSEWIYSAGIYLFKASKINSRTWCEICSELTKTSKRPHWHENINNQWWRSDVFIVNFEQIPHLFLVFLSWIWENVADWVYRRRSKGRDTNIIKHAKAGTKLCNINQTGQTTTRKETWSNLKRMQSKALSKYLWNVLRFSFHKNNFFVGNKIVLETSSVAITNTSCVHCFDQLSHTCALRDLEQLIQVLKNRQAGFALSITKLK